MQGHGRPPGEMPRQRRDDVLGEQHAAAVHPEGAFDAARVELWEAPWQLVERHLLHRLADAGQYGGRALCPGLAVAGERQRPGGRVETLAEIAPHQVPGSVGTVDHARITRMIAVGMTDQAMLVHRQASGLGSGPCSNNSTACPSRATAHAVASPMMPPPTTIAFMAPIRSALIGRDRNISYSPALAGILADDQLGLLPLRAIEIEILCRVELADPPFLRRDAQQALDQGVL